MAEIKPSYTDLVYQVVRESPEPLAFAEIVGHVAELCPVTTKNPKATIRNAIGQGRLIVSTGDGRYGWKYRLITGSILRLPLTGSDLTQHRLVYNHELSDALWPAFFEIQKRAERSPVQLALPDGKTIALTLNFLGEATWGVQDAPEIWEWLQVEKAQPGDDLIFTVTDGEARRYAIEFQPHEKRDEPAITARNHQLREAILAYAQRARSDVLLWDVSSHLLAYGLYRHPVPPDPLKQIINDRLSGSHFSFIPAAPREMPAKQPEIDPLIASLLEQIGESPRRRRSKKAAAQALPPGQICQILVTLQDIQPPIWRRIQVPHEISLPRLHAVLQIAMGWTNSHLHSFTAHDIFYSEPDPEDPGWLNGIDERTVTLKQIAPEVGAHFIYEYDFGDSWDHELVIEQIFPAEAEARYPLCLDGKRACPLEDSGGVGGYAEFLRVIRNRRHPEHSQFLEWAGGKFNPEAFDLERANELLRMLG